MIRFVRLLSLTHNLIMNFWYDPKKRGILFQVILLTFVILVVGILVFNTQQNLASQNIATGFGFLSQEAGFQISETLLHYWPDDTYLKALQMGFLNTLKVGVLGNILAITLGIILGVLRLSKNWMISKLGQVYIEVIRNIPLLLQLLFWYALFTEVFPNVKEAFSPIDGLYLSQRGLFFPILKEHMIWKWVQVSFLLGVAVSFFLFKFLNLKSQKLGRKISFWPYAFVFLLIIPFLIWLLGGAPFQWEYPQLGKFNFEGGGGITPEFSALMVGLILYTSAFNAEIVRAGIESVDKGQWEAAESLGLTKFQSLRFIILPQSMRVVIPPMTSQVLNLIKNSSLAVGIGYPDFVAVANTTMNQTGQAIEGVMMIMMVYLFFSLISSFGMNLYHRKTQLRQR